MVFPASFKRFFQSSFCLFKNLSSDSFFLQFFLFLVILPKFFLAFYFFNLLSSGFTCNFYVFLTFPHNLPFFLFFIILEVCLIPLVFQRFTFLRLLFFPSGFHSLFVPCLFIDLCTVTLFLYLLLILFFLFPCFFKTLSSLSLLFFFFQSPSSKPWKLSEFETRFSQLLI